MSFPFFVWFCSEFSNDWKCSAGETFWTDSFFLHERTLTTGCFRRVCFLSNLKWVSIRYASPFHPEGWTGFLHRIGERVFFLTRAACDTHSRRVAQSKSIKTASKIKKIFNKRTPIKAIDGSVFHDETQRETLWTCALPGWNEVRPIFSNPTRFR